jgi:leucyl/phenylalanyl-tRNA---protein transferase
MALFALDNSLVFPPVQLSEPDGLLALGGDLSAERLLLAYRSGIFPWFEGDTPLWWSPDPRFVLFPNELKISHSMRQVLKKGEFRLTVNRAFSEVIRECKNSPRKGQLGTWITPLVEEAYNRLHQLGHAYSAETWLDGRLVGGCYGIRMGKVFFGESMFSLVSNASKFAFISYVQQLQSESVQIIDCQIYTEHLESLGAKMIPRDDFITYLNQFIPPPQKP